MFPILYENISVGVVPQHHGLGTLSDAISCIVEEERNGKYQLTLEYPITGIHASDIAYRRILKVKPNYTDPAQLFRIDRIGKTMNGKFTIYAKHISYDISGYDILSGEANNVVSACAMLTQATQLDPEHHPDEKFTIETSKTTTGIFSIKEPSSVRSWFGGKEGSLLDVYGGGEWHYNNFTCKLWEHRGVVEARETIRYTKNLLELSQEIDSSNLYTDVICFYKNDSGVMVASEKRSTGLSLDVPKVLLVDVSSEFDTEPSEAMLNDAADAYIGSHNLTVPSNNITLDFVQSGELTGRVDLCDKVNVYYEAFGINAEFKCIRTKWDCLRENYIETEFGDAKQSLADTISQTTSTVDTIAGIAGDKKRVFVNQPVPPYDVGDLWVNDGTIYYCIEGKKETIIKEEEGEVITFNTLQKANLLECKAGINFVQAGSGTPSSSNIRQITGFEEANISRSGKNLLNIADGNGTAMRGVTPSYDDDGGLNFSGTVSDNGWIGSWNVDFTLPAGTYTFSVDSSEINHTVLFCLDWSAKVSINKNSSSRTVTFNEPQRINRITIQSNNDDVGQSVSINIKKMQIELGSTSTDFEPYEGEVYNLDIRINKGVNIWDEDWESGGIQVADGQPYADVNRIRSKNFIPIEPNTQYYAYHRENNMYIFFYDEDYNYLTHNAFNNATFTTYSSYHYCKFHLGSYANPVTTYRHNISINYPATDHLYHAHTGDAVYKGELNVTTGELKVTHNCIDLGDVSWTQISVYQGKKAFYTEVLNDMKPATASNTKIDAACEQYDLKTGDAVYLGQDGFSGWSTQKRIAIYDSSKENLTAAEFQAAMQGIKLVYELNEPITINVDANEIETLLFNNMWTDTNGSIYAKYMYLGFASDDWQLATDFVNETNLEDSIRNATQIITGAVGGNVIINYKDVTVDGVITQRPYEILILCDADTIDEATQIWRWNAGGLGYSDTGYDGDYDTAISVDLQTGKGYINADFITAGVLDASLVTIRDLTATMFKGNTIILGGSDNSKLEVQDTSRNPLIRINRTGMECFGSTVNNITPSVVFDKNGVTGYSNSDPAAKPTSKIFWTNKDSFQMKNAVIENEASFGGKIKFVPITVGNFEGIAVVPVI